MRKEHYILRFTADTYEKANQEACKVMDLLAPNENVISLSHIWQYDPAIPATQWCSVFVTVCRRTAA